MAARRKPVEAPANRLLGLLPPADYRRLRRHLKPIPLTYRQSLYRARQPVGFVYFIETGVGSLVNTMANGQAAEVGTTMRRVMLRYAHALFNQVAQSAACNHFHTLEQRCRRWMLMTHDRMASDAFLLTQEFLAMMLGVQRTGVSEAAGGLQRAGLIRYRRGVVTILDQRGLRQRACECYGIAKREFDRLLGDPPSRKAPARKVPSRKLKPRKVRSGRV